MRLLWTAPARADLRQIDRWLNEHADQAAAARTLATILDRADFLESFPHGGRPMLQHGFRVLPVSSTRYLLVYRLIADQVQILRIRHEREDWRPE